MKKKLGLAALAGLSGCIFVHSAATSDLLLRGQSAAFESGRNHVAVHYGGPWGNDGLNDDLVLIKSYGINDAYGESQMFVSSGDETCVLGVKLEFEIINDNDGNPYNNMLKVYAGRCR